MKRTISGTTALAFSLLLSLSSCRGHAPQASEQTAEGEFEATSEQADGIQRMHTYDYSDTLRTGGHVYAYTIHREADDALPIVSDDEGVSFADNRYTLSILREGQSFFERTFTKANFASYLSKEFQQKGLLDGMMCDRSLPGLTFAVSVTLPQSDMVEPLLLRVDANGGIAIERDTRSENDFEEEQE